MEASPDKTKKELLKLPSIINDRSFITESKGKEGSVQDRISEYNNAIKQQMNTLNQDIDSVLQRHEQDFLNAFKYQMYNLYTQIKDLKKASNSTGMNLRHNEELQQLQRSLDLFKQEAVKLGNTVEENKKEIESLIEKNKELQEDNRFYKSRLKMTKKKLKLLKFDQVRQPSPEQTLITTVETSPQPLVPSKFVPSSKSGEIIAELLQRYKRSDTALFKELEVTMEKQAKHFSEATKHLQSIISNEKRKFQTFTLTQSSVFLEKSELENLFLDCVEEVKKEINHRRAKSLRLQKFPLKSSQAPKEKGEIFSPADKRKIMELLISNEQVLIMLYEKLFPFRASQYGNPQKPDPAFDQLAPDIDSLLKSLPAMDRASPVPINT